MPTVLRIEGLRDGVELRETIRCSETETRRVLRLVAPHREALLQAWRQWHGEA